MPQIPNGEKGVLFQLLSMAEFSKLLERNEISIFNQSTYDAIVPIAKGGIQLGNSHNHPGIMLSSWITIKDGHPGRIKPILMDLVHRCVGDGFGSRKRSPSHGVNFYYGPRLSALSRASPVEGPGKQNMSMYF